MWLVRMYVNWLILSKFVKLSNFFVIDKFWWWICENCWILLYYVIFMILFSFPYISLSQIIKTLRKTRAHYTRGLSLSNSISAESFAWLVLKNDVGLGFRKVVMSCRRQLHTTVSHDGPTETLKRIIMELEKTRSKKNSKKRDDIFVQVPESMSFLDTATMPMILTVVGTAPFAKLLMMVCRDIPILIGFGFYWFLN